MFMPRGIDFGVMDITAARGHGSLSRSTRAAWPRQHAEVRPKVRHFHGICAQARYNIMVFSMLPNFYEISMVVTKVTETLFSVHQRKRR